MRFLRDEPGHADDLPSGGLRQPARNVVEMRDAIGRAQFLHRVDEGAAHQPGQLRDLARVQTPVGVVVSFAAVRAVLVAGAVAARPRFVPARGPVAGAVGHPARRRR